MPNQDNSTVDGFDKSIALRRRMRLILEDIKEVRDQGKMATTNTSEFVYFKGMYGTLTNLFERFDEFYNNLADLTDENGESLATADDAHLRKTAKRYFNECHGFMIMSTDSASAQPCVSNASQMGNHTLTSAAPRARAKLPTISLPKFKGDRKNWPRFRDLFESLVIGDSELTDIDRYHYLVATVEEPAAAVISNLPLTADNFEVAWESLKSVYNNQRLLAATYLDQILDMKSVDSRPSAEHTSNHISELSEVVSAYRLLKIADSEEFIFFHLALRTLDTSTRVAFENANDMEFPKFSELVKFLRKRSIAAELAQPHAASKETKPLNKRTTFSPRAAVLTSSVMPTSSTKYHNSSGSCEGKRSKGCYVCKSEEIHPLQKCFKFCSATPEERHTLLRGWHGCRNCLASSHLTQICSSKFRCKHCLGRHHTQLHLETGRNSSNKSIAGTTHKTSSPVVVPSDKLTPAFSSSNVASTSRLTKAKSVLASQSSAMKRVETMLGTATCLLSSPSGDSQPIRLVLDSGSHFSFVTRECAERIGLIIEPHSTAILGIGETPLRGFKGQARCKLTPLNSSAPLLFANAVVVDKITTPLPGFNTPTQIWEPYGEYDLADPMFWVTRPIDFLLGCDLFSDILTSQVIAVKHDFPKLLGTVFGFVVVGRVKDLQEAVHAYTLHTGSITPTDALHLELQRFWELEEPPLARKVDPLADSCELHFATTHYRLPSGRYGVRLPFKVSNPQLLGSRSVATKRLHHLENKLERNSLIKSKYQEFMRDYIELGHMELAKQPGKVYIPHHCVVKGEGNALKLRVVFDASAKCSGSCLNDSLMVGPKLQADITTILLNFRIHAFVFVTDAVKMFRQIELHPDDRTYQHILVRLNLTDRVEDYVLNTVTYGTTCAPYLANRVIRQLVIDEGPAYPLASAAMSEDMYVDDVATGAQTLSQALQLQHEIVELMSKGGFTLGKWASNHPRLNEISTKATNTSIPSVPVDFESIADIGTVKILGMQWDSEMDEFLYAISTPEITCTKRGVLSTVARIYDPLGYIGPTVILAKEIIQSAWKRQLSWDETFPEEMARAWTSFIEQLSMLGKIRIPRWILSQDTTALRLLIFADASERAYCAAAYVHETSANHVRVNLLMAKTKLAPLKTTTIPRLELCAALLATRLRQSLDCFCNRVGYPVRTHYFTDSTVVLAWLSTPSFQLKTFVANRVETILDVTNGDSWHHVASADNPSDLGSRGVIPESLLNNHLWFHGPDWASKVPSEWGLQSLSTLTEIPEMKSTVSALITSSEIPPIIKWISRFSHFTRLCHSFAYILRFTAIVKKSCKYPSLSLTLGEIREATLHLVRIVQAYYFFDRNAPQKNLLPPKNLHCLHPFFNDQGVLLVGGRIRHSNVSWSVKHPILIPAKTHFTKLLIEHYHRTLLHPGNTLLLAHLRTKYWVLGAKNTIRFIKRNCVTCRKLDAVPTQPLMGDLPRCRFREGRAFLHVGVDFAGPFTVKTSNRRKANTTKAYLSLFICLSTKAIHLEIVSSLSTEAFFAALERLVGRRGLPERIVSDNGTNFIGTANNLKELYDWYLSMETQETLQAYASSLEIEWSFICPSAPFMGGIWEAGIKAVKRLLRTVYGEATLNFEELSTWFVRVEAILNSRPLCPLSTDPSDLSYLSPGHFLIGSPLLAIPEKSLISLPENRLSHWQLVYQKTQHFWKRWRLEYLSSLQERSKWQKQTENLKVGDLVIISTETSPRLQWPVGRIIEVHPGLDKIVRVATVKTSRTVLKRPVNKLIPLFMPNSQGPSNAAIVGEHNAKI